MSGLIDTTTGLRFGDGLHWLNGGIGGDGLDAQPAPSWVLTAGGVAATLDIDFVNNLAWNSPQTTTIASLLTCTRATPVAAYYTKADGTLTTFAANTLRYGTNGLLVEESRTNLFLQSADFSTTWGINIATLSANAAAAPDGTITADKVIPSASDSAAHGAYQLGTTVSNATAYAYSVYAKASGYGGLQIIAHGADSSWGAAFNLDTGATAGKGANVTSLRIEALANGWYRCTAIVTSNSTSADVRLFVCPSANLDGSGGINSYVGNAASGVLLWGAQLEAGAFATSYIPTTTVAVTRAADVVMFASIPAVITAIATAAGTMYFQYPSVGRVGPYYFDFSSAGNRPVLYKDNPTTNTYFDGTNNPGSNLTEAATGSVNKVARAWSGSTLSSVIGGAAAISTAWDGDWNIGAPTFGSGFGGSYVNGTILRIAVWNSRVSNGNLQTLTT